MYTGKSLIWASVVLYYYSNGENNLFDNWNFARTLIYNVYKIKKNIKLEDKF